MDRILNSKEDLAVTVGGTGKPGLGWQQSPSPWPLWHGKCSTPQPCGVSTTLPYPLSSSHTGLRARLQTHQAHECFQHLCTCCSAWNTLRLHPTHFPLLLLSMNSNVPQGLPSHIFVIENHPTVHFLASLLCFFSAHYDYLLT